MGLYNSLYEDGVRDAHSMALELAKKKPIETVYIRLGSYLISLLYGIKTSGKLTKKVIKRLIFSEKIRREIITLLYSFYRFIMGYSRLLSLKMIGTSNRAISSDRVIIDMVSKEPLKSKYDFVKNNYQNKEI